MRKLSFSGYPLASATSAGENGSARENNAERSRRQPEVPPGGFSITEGAPMSKRFLVLVLLAGLFAFTPRAHTEDPPSGKNKRMIYLVKHNSAKDLAGVLGKHFKSDADIQVLPDSPSNCLLISAAPDVFTEVVKLLEQLDRRPQLVAVEVFFVEAASKKADDTKPDSPPKGLEEKEFTGPSKDVVSKIDALMRKGTVAGYRRLQLAAAENQQASAMVGEMKPVVTGSTVTGTGIAARHITYRNVGANVKATVRVTGDNSVSVDLEIEDARLHTPADGIVVGKDEKGEAIRAAETVLSKAKNKVNVPAGQAVAVEGVKTESKSGLAQTLIIVTARVLEDDKGGK
jgi:type II secretory pathway component GspD/PulD (secretin)